MGLYALGIFLQPLYGDLTRLGGYSEREFGWTAPQLKFSKPLYTRDEYSRYHDVVILGDSFSRAWPEHQWQNYVVAATGWSIVTLDINSVNLKSILESESFRVAPPKLFILQSVERKFPERIKNGGKCEETQVQMHSSRFTALRSDSINRTREIENYVGRERNWEDIKLGFVTKYLWNNASRMVGGAERTEVRKLDLKQTAPFSSSNKSSLLVYKVDIEKSALWNSMALSEMTCRIDRIRNQVEANGQTRFVLMVAPDKLTAYSDYVSDNNLSALSRLAQFSQQSAGFSPRIDLALKSAIRNGEQDVYLPDDTHWGAAGHRITAETLLSFLRRDQLMSSRGASAGLSNGTEIAKRSRVEN